MSNGFDISQYSLEQLAEDYYNGPQAQPEANVETPQEPLENLPQDNPELSLDENPELNPQDLEHEPILDNPEDPLNPDLDTNLSGQNGSQEFRPLKFKANDREITIDNEQDAIRLMQQSFGAQKLVADYKEARPIIKALRDNNLMDAKVVNTIIAASKGDARAYKAMQAMFNVSGEQLDELNYNDDDGKDFNPENSIQDGSIFNLRDTVDEMDSYYPEESDHIREVFATMDDQSIMTIKSDPSILLDLAHLKQSGHLDAIVSTMEQAYMLGKIPANTPKVAVLGTLANQLSQQLGYNVLDRAASKPTPQQIEPQQQNQPPVQQQQANPPTLPPRSEKRRLAGGTPERYNQGAPTPKAPVDKASSTLEKLRKGEGDPKKLLEDFFQIQMD